MIYVLTVHWQSDFWVEPQLRNLQRFTDSPYRVFSFADDSMDVSRYAGRDDLVFVRDYGVRGHAAKLSLLADMVALVSSSDDDLLVFIDSDAFPVARWEAPVRDLLKSVPLVAVRRDENAGDIQPHPCFCVTTLGFWKRIRGDWRDGFSWRNIEGKSVTDVGGALLGTLEREGHAWHPLLRTNTVELHPVMFAVYGGLVYHHGAGSRLPMCRRDTLDIRQEMPVAWLLRGVRMARWRRERARRNEQLSARVRQMVVDDVDLLATFQPAPRVDKPSAEGVQAAPGQ